MIDALEVKGAGKMVQDGMQTVSAMTAVTTSGVAGSFVHPYSTAMGDRE